MRKSAWMLIALTASLAGCTPSYRVHVNTYSELKEGLDRASPIYVAVDPNSQNPILRRQIAMKIRDLLSGDGFNPVDTQDAAAYILTFEVGIDSERVLDYAPVSRPFGGYYGGYYGHGFGWGLGYSTYAPYFDTVYTHWLRMRLYATKNTGPKPDVNEPPRRLPGRQNVWLGEALIGTESPELRETVNYLLVGCIQYLGADTQEWVTMTIRKDDPRIEGITAD
ncbi:MAG: hypothetical protein ACM3VT_00385 [Solirubrobacterales bacterium]